MMYSTTTQRMVFVVLAGLLVASVGQADSGRRRRRHLVDSAAFSVAEASEARPLSQQELDTVLRGGVAEVRLLRFCILAMERGESRSWLQPPSVVPGWPDVRGATHPIVVALRAYARELQTPGAFNVSAYLDVHGRAGYYAEVLLHWPALRDGMRSAAVQRGIELEEVEAGPWAQLAEAERDEGPALSTHQRVRRSLDLGRRARLVSSARIIELGQPGIDAYATMFAHPEQWPEWAASGPDRNFFVQTFLNTMIAWGDDRWTIVAPADWSAMGAGHEVLIRREIAAGFGKTWPELSREYLMLDGYVRSELARRQVRP